MLNITCNPFPCRMGWPVPAMPTAWAQAGQAAQPRTVTGTRTPVPSGGGRKPAREKPVTGKQHVAERRYCADEISEGDLERIVNLCGTNNIEEIYDVTSMQTMMIRRMRKIKDSFVIQMMIRTKLKMDSIAFREQVDAVCEKLDNLRSVYVYRGMDKPYRVVLKNRTADVAFFDLSDQLRDASPETVNARLEELMEADRRNGFDLERSALLRISIYRLDHEDGYAILFSQPHVNSDGVSVGMLIKDIFIAYGLKIGQGIELPVESSSFREYAEHLKTVDMEKEFQYWKDYLSGFGEETRLPGYIPSNLDYELNLYFQPFREETVKNLRGMQSSCKATFATIVQTVWAILLAKLSGNQDVLFGLVTAGRDSDVINSMKISGGFINTLLLRSHLMPDTAFHTAVRVLQEDGRLAAEHSHCSPDELRDRMQRGSAWTNQILNFHNYGSRAKTGNTAEPALPGMQILGMDVYDNLSYDLVLYFKENEEGRYGCTFAYNAKAWTRETIQLLGEVFSSYLDRTAERKGELLVSEYPAPDFRLFQIAMEAMAMESYKKTAFLKSLPLFQDVDEESLMRLTEKSVILSCQRDEQIFTAEENRDSLLFVMDGYIDLSMTGRDGWNRKISVEKPGNLLPFAEILQGGPRITVTAASETAAVMQVPEENVLQLLSQYPEIAMRIIRLLENKWLNYGRLWASVE